LIETLKRKALRRPQKTDIEGVDDWTWHVGADCSKYGQQQGRPDCRQRTTGVKVECVHLCRVAGNSVWSHTASGIP